MNLRFLFILIFSILWGHSVFASQCNRTMQELLSAYDEQAAKTEIMLENFMLARGGTENLTVAQKLDDLEETLEDRILREYEKFDKVTIRKPNIEKADNTLISIEEITSVTNQFLDLIEELRVKRFEIRKGLRVFNNSKKPARVKIIKEISNELIEEQSRQVDMSLSKLLDEWQELVRGDIHAINTESVSNLKQKINQLKIESLEVCDSIIDRTKDIIERLDLPDDSLAKVSMHPSFIKDKKSVPNEIRVKALLFMLDLTRATDRRTLNDFGYDNVTHFGAAKDSNKIPKNVQFWHYHLKRGTKDHVIIWAVNKKDKYRTYYPLWVGPHGKAPYMSNGKFVSWMKSKLLFILD